MRINPISPIAQVSAVTGSRSPVFYGSGLRAAQPAVPPRRSPNSAGGRAARAHIAPDVQTLRGNIDAMRSVSLPQPLTLAQRWENGREASGQTRGGGAFERCATCAERGDRPAGGTLNMQMPPRNSLDEAPPVVIAHEREHLASMRTRAAREGHRVLGQYTVIHMGVCAECSLAYVTGGEARTVIAPKRNIYAALRAYYSVQNMSGWIY